MTRTKKAQWEWNDTSGLTKLICDKTARCHNRNGKAILPLEVLLSAMAGRCAVAPPVAPEPSRLTAGLRCDDTWVNKHLSLLKNEDGGEAGGRGGVPLHHRAVQGRLAEDCAHHFQLMSHDRMVSAKCTLKCPTSHEVAQTELITHV